MTIIFVDVRGSTQLAEGRAPAEVGDLLAPFFESVTQALIETDGFIIDFRGDCVVAVYPPGLSGEDYESKAVEAVRHLQRGIAPKTPENTPLPFGIGVHTGTIWIGTVRGAEGGMLDIMIQGDNVNITARLSQIARPGEALISDVVCKNIQMPIDKLEAREVELKGKSTPVAVHVMSGSTN